MTDTSVFTPLIRFYKKMTPFGQILFFLSFFLILVVFFNFIQRAKLEKQRNEGTLQEGYQQNDSFVFKTETEVFDGFYADIYDQLLFNKLKDDYEVGQIIQHTEPTSESVILDIGSGTGNHVAKFTDLGYQTLGVDLSPSMVKKAQEKYPACQFIQGDVTRSEEFQTGTFTHILCLYFTIYHMKNKPLFFQNCYRWLKPGGYLVVHLVNRDKFDPILPAANGLLVVSPQKYAKERITHSKVHFNEFVYQSDFKLDSAQNMGIFEEKMTFPNGKVRKNEHRLYMEPQSHIIQYAQEVGFIVQGKIELVHCAYEYQYLYILYKPS